MTLRDVCEALYVTETFRTSTTAPSSAAYCSLFRRRNRRRSNVSLRTGYGSLMPMEWLYGTPRGLATNGIDRRSDSLEVVGFRFARKGNPYLPSPCILYHLPIGCILPIPVGMTRRSGRRAAQSVVMQFYRVNGSFWSSARDVTQDHMLSEA